MATLCVACATAPPAPTGTVELRLLPGQSPIAEVDGPYAAYSRVGHGVVVRIWPDSIGDGTVDLSIIVRNTDLDKIRLMTADIVATGETGPIQINGEEEMLARFDAEPVRRTISPSFNAALGSLSRATTSTLSTSDGVVKLDAPTRSYSVSRSDTPDYDDLEEDEAIQEDRQARRAQIAAWYLGSMEIEAGETGVGGISMSLPETGQTIILNVDIDSEDHEFALVFERHQ
jgi:hypothetical protein